MDGIDRLLQIVAYYRRRQPQSPEVKPTTAALSSLTRRAQNRCKVLAFHPRGQVSRFRSTTAAFCHVVTKKRNGCTLISDLHASQRSALFFPL